jgi:hypothetical protein
MALDLFPAVGWVPSLALQAQEMPLVVGLRATLLGSGGLQASRLLLTLAK